VIRRDGRNADFLTARAELLLLRARHRNSRADRSAAADDLRAALQIDPRHREARALAASE
jgi:hypothetical protein